MKPTIYSETFARYMPPSEHRSTLAREIAATERRIENSKSGAAKSKRRDSEKVMVLIRVLEIRLQKMRDEYAATQTQEP